MNNITSILQNKKNQKITMITAYDALFASLFDDYVDMILVGDSLMMSFAGKKDTLAANMDIMIYHTKAVCEGSKKAIIVTDMPFGSYTSEKQALKNASRVYQETSAHAVKIEGSKPKIIKSLTKNSIAVVGHIGLLPQNVRLEGGYKLKGKESKSIEKLVENAKQIEDAGAFCIVIEGVTNQAAKAINDAIEIPTIGIGAGSVTDGQVLVWSDMLGFFEKFKPKFVKQYFDGSAQIRQAIQQYVEEVRNGTFPNELHSYN